MLKSKRYTNNHTIKSMIEPCSFEFVIDANDALSAEQIALASSSVFKVPSMYLF